MRPFHVEVVKVVQIHFDGFKDLEGFDDNERVTMRKLLYIPIVHTPEDFGSHLEKVRRQYIARHGHSKWRDPTEALEKFWRELSNALLNLPVDYAKVRVYQDSLPVCGRELQIVEALAQDGNRNYQLLSELVKKGATVMGSEDPKLLIEERDRLSRKSVTGSYDDLMERRDEYIAQRIASTLKDGEIGLLLMGALHRVAERLPKDIEVRKSTNELKEGG